jgi:hypothetical protein
MPALPLTDFLYGTELPDNGGASEGIGDTSKHHVYFFANGLVQDDASAQRAQQEQNNAVNLFKAGDLTGAAKRLGMMTHYISDVGVFGHVMSSVTDWGAETHHSDYEDYVNDRTNIYASEFSSFLTFDGNLENISAYDAAVMLANDTTFDGGGGQACVWMNQNYNWADPVFRNRCGESLNLATNLVADALHTSFIEMASVQSSSTLHVVINEVELSPPETDYGTEWVELLNPATSPVNIGGWTISTTAGVTVTVTIPQGTIIQPEGYFVYTHYTQWLDNSNECVVLRDASHSEVDRTPVLSDSANDANSWSRYPNGVDTDSSADWRFQLSTKGGSNGKVASSISCDVTLSQPSAGNTAKVNGQITPVHQAALVEITFTKPSGPPEKRTLATDSSGAYEDQFFLDQSGAWVASASWKGDYDHEQAQSLAALFTVEPGDVYPPVTSDNYDGLWHTTDFAITLTATDDYSGVNETFYRINDGQIKSTIIDGEPIILTEKAHNILEYWSVDNGGHEESHHMLTGIKLDKTIPLGSIIINNGAIYANSTSVTLSLNATDIVSGIYRMRFSNDGVWDTEPWELFLLTKSWTLTSGDGHETVYYQIKDNAGLLSPVYEDTTILDTSTPTGSILINEGTPYANSSKVTLQLSANDSGSGVDSMRFSNDGTTWSDWEAYSSSKNRTLISGDEIKTVYYQIKDNANLISMTYAATVILDTSPPNITQVYQTPMANVKPENDVRIDVAILDANGVETTILSYTTGNGTWITVKMVFTGRSMWNASIPTFPKDTNITYIVMAKDVAGNPITTEELGSVYEYQVIPEYPSFLILPMFVIATLLVVIVYRKKLAKI